MQHISVSVPVAEASDMETIWVLLIIGVTFADKLDRTYLPPVGSAYSGGSPGAIRVPLELPKPESVIHDGKFTKSPELVIGIDRAGPNQVNNIFEEISTHRPQNYNNPPTKTTSSYFDQSSPLPKLQSISQSTPGIQKVDYISDPQKIQNFQPGPSILDDNNRAYLPPYSGKVDNKESVVDGKSSTPVINENHLSDDHKFIHPDSIINQHSSSLNPTSQPQNLISSTPSVKNLFPTMVHDNIPSGIYSSSVDPQNLNNVPIQITDKEYSALDNIRSHRPERVQAESDRQATIINYGQTLTPEGYAYGYDTSNGIHADEEGITTNGVKAKGSYSYIGDDGNVYQVDYTADENGFLPKGAHLPTAPPIPDAILKVIEQAAKDEEAGIYDDGSYNEEKYRTNKHQGYKSSNIINRGSYPAVKEMKMKIRDEIKSYEDSQITNEEEFKNNIETNKQNENHDDNIPYDSGLQNTDSPYLNKNNNQLLSQKQQYNINSDEPNNFGSTTPKLDVSLTSDKLDETNSQSMSGYEYFPPQSHDTDKIELFPTRFSGISADYDKLLEENKKEKVTAKPFLTPYVSRKDDEMTYFDEQENEENSENDPTRAGFIQENFKPIDKSTFGDDDIHSLEFTSGQQPYYEEKIRNPLVSDKDGYFYQNAKKPFIIVDSSTSYTSSTAAPTDFPSRISTTQHISVTPERDPSSYQTKTTTVFGTPSTKSPISLLPTQTIRPYFINEATSGYPDTYGKTDAFPKIIPTSSFGLGPGIVRSGMTYEPEANHRNVYVGPTSTEKVVGEDFTGPKQPQRFDPMTGYHY